RQERMLVAKRSRWERRRSRRDRSGTACMRRMATTSRRSRITRRKPSESSRSSCWSESRNTRDEAGEEQGMEGPPPQYTAKTLDDYLEHLSKGVFQAGISWRVVDGT